jgi:hypothetical protein
MTYYVLLCRHGPHQRGQLVADEKTKAFPTQSVTEVLRERLWFQSPYGDEPIQLRQVLYAPALEVRQTTDLLGAGLGWIHKRDEGTEFALEPLRGSAGQPRDGAQPHSRRVRSVNAAASTWRSSSSREMTAPSLAGSSMWQLARIRRHRLAKMPRGRLWPGHQATLS